MSGGGGQTTQTIQSADPWSGAQPYLKDIFGQAQGLYQSGQGFQPFPESTVVPFASQTEQALQGIQSLSSLGNPLAGPGLDQAIGQLTSGGLTDWQRGALGQAYDVATGARQVGTEPQLQGLLGTAAAGGPIQGYLGDYASGANITGGSPQFKAALDYQSAQLANDINRGFSNAGRYGSGAHTGELGEQIGNFRNQALAQEIAREQGLQQQAAGMIGQEYQQGIGNQAGLLGQIGQTQGANIVNAVGAGHNIANIGNQAANQAAQWAALSPNLYSQIYSPFERLASVGSVQEDLATRQLQDQISRFQQSQQAPYQSLANYAGLLGGAGQLGGTTNSKTTAPSTSPLIGGLGGALSGAGLAGAIPALGPFGLPLAIGGGLLGAFS